MPPRIRSIPARGAVAVAWTLRNPAVNGAIVKHDIATILRRK